MENIDFSVFRSWPNKNFRPQEVCNESFISPIKKIYNFMELLNRSITKRKKFE